jgi:hypothetical protein
LPRHRAVNELRENAIYGAGYCSPKQPGSELANVAIDPGAAPMTEQLARRGRERRSLSSRLRRRRLVENEVDLDQSVAPELGDADRRA